MAAADGEGRSPDEHPALSVAHLSKTFPGTRALIDVSLAVAAGEVHALVGGNGSGKSTLVKVIAGLHPADRGGTLSVGRATVAANRVDPAWSRAAGLRFVHQDPGVFLDLTVAENLAIGTGFPTRGVHAVDWRALRARTRALLERFGIDCAPSTPVRTLHPADRVMLAIARALADDRDAARVLVLDEPTAALPADRSALVWAAILRAVADGNAVLFVSHRLDEVVAHADAVTVLRDGRHVGSLQRRDLSEAALAAVLAGGTPTGADRSAPVDRSDPAAGAPVRVALAVNDLRGGPVHGVSFEVHAGEVVGLAGPVGAGQSELLQMLFGALRVRSGTIALDGVPTWFTDVGDAMRAGVAYVPADRGDATFADLALFENLSAATVASYWRGLRMHHAQEVRDARSSMSRFSIRASSPQQVMATVSGGNQQKALLARWLRREPAILLLDEPTRGVDVAARADLYGLVAQATRSGCAALVVSDDFVELATVCDRVLVMIGGSVVAEVQRPHIDAERLAELAFGASAA